MPLTHEPIKKCRKCGRYGRHDSDNQHIGCVFAADQEPAMCAVCKKHPQHYPSRFCKECTHDLRLATARLRDVEIFERSTNPLRKVPVR